jgi:hypothetical protein
VIRAPQKQVAAVLDLFQQIDRRPRRLKLSLRLLGAESRRSAVRAAEGGVRVGNAEVQKRSGLETKGAVRAKVGGVAVVAGDSESSFGENNVGTVEILEGQRGSIRADGPEESRYLELKPTLIGKDRVRVEVYQDGSHRALSTELDLKLGAWVPLGGMGEDSAGSRGEILGRRVTTKRSRHQYEIRVDLISSPNETGARPQK